MATGEMAVKGNCPPRVLGRAAQTPPQKVSAKVRQRRLANEEIRAFIKLIAGHPGQGQQQQCSSLLCHSLESHGSCPTTRAVLKGVQFFGQRSTDWLFLNVKHSKPLPGTDADGCK